MLLWLGAFIAAVLPIAAFAVVTPVRNWWTGFLTLPWKLAVGVTVVFAVLIATNFFHSTVAEPSESACVVEGQVFDVDGSPLRGASIVARPISGFKESLIDSYFDARVATTDLQGRFRADCSRRAQPHFVAVNFQQYEGDDPDTGRCEWWDAGGFEKHRIDGDGTYQFNIVIPVGAVKSNSYPYNDDYRCSDSDWGPSASVPGG